MPTIRPQPAIPPGPTLGRRLQKSLIKGTLLTVFLLVAGFSLYTWGTLQFTYSRGERAGYVQKISQRGWLFKTWEGELAMVNLPGAMPEKFIFSVRDEVVAKRIAETLGNRVVLTYQEHRGIPLRIFGDTAYFVNDVKLFEESAPAGTPVEPSL